MSRNFLHLIRCGFAPPPVESDADLLRRFIDHRDESAFATIMDRHGPMVWAVCRNTLPNRADAEDVFQATFFALSRGAKAVRHPERLAAWLHGAAVRVAGGVKRVHARRVRYERAAARTEADSPVADAAWGELLLAAHEEVAAMSPALRAAFILCDIEGWSSGRRRPGSGCG
ncbi:RNA polymerase sigma factor [Frigoriglobus tundricola]|nr:RNA polymerase sigma factor [Frigoriglobus tundricola]